MGFTCRILLDHSPLPKVHRLSRCFLRMANRHGLIAGATGTGKTTTLRVLAENFSEIGVPVFLADIKGDLSGLAKAGGDNQKIVERAAEVGLPGTDADRGIPLRSGMPMGSPVLRSGPPCPKWGRSSLPVSLTSMISRPMS